jgi:hypothetical protein
MRSLYRQLSFVLVLFMLFNPVLHPVTVWAMDATATTTETATTAGTDTSTGTTTTNQPATDLLNQGIERFAPKISGGLQTMVEMYKNYKANQDKDAGSEVSSADKAVANQSKASTQQGQELANQGQQSIAQNEQILKDQANRDLGAAQTTDLSGGFKDAADAQTGLDKFGQTMVKIGGIMKTVGAMLTSIGTMLAAIPYTAVIGAAMVKIGKILTTVGGVVEMLGKGDIAGAAKAASTDFDFAKASSDSAPANAVTEGSTTEAGSTFTGSGDTTANTSTESTATAGATDRGGTDTPVGAE